jgi:hypothetical protein
MDQQDLTIAIGRRGAAMTTPPIYANTAHVSCTPFDFCVSFSLLCPPDASDGAGAEIPSLVPRPVAEVVMPAAAVAALIDLLRSELDDFTSAFGPPVPAPHQLRESRSTAARGARPVGLA